MPTRAIEQVGHRAVAAVEAFGDFCRFNAKALRWIIQGGISTKTLRLMLPQMFDVGVRSIPVIAVTGAFIGMVMAVEMFPQFKNIGQEQRMGTVICLSVVKQIGPVLAALML